MRCKTPARSALLIPAFLAVAAAACTGHIDDLGPGASEPDQAPGLPGAGAPSAAKGGTGGLIDMPGPRAPAEGAACSQGALPPTPRLVRLTRLQYENSVRDLTGLDVRPAKELPADNTLLGFDRGMDLEVGDLLGRVFREQAELIARQVVSSATNLKQVVSCDPRAGETCLKAFVAEFGRRAFRRPLSTAERERYERLFREGDRVVPTGDSFAKGVQVVVEAMLQSPHFLYRYETSTRRDGPYVALDSHEIAARLSYMLTNSMPDAPLREAADRGQLTDAAAVATHARRLLATARGKATILDFFGQWMGASDWENHLDKNATRYPLWRKSILPTLQQELALYAEAVTFERKRGLATLLTAPFSFVNRATAPIYGLTGTFGDAPIRAELDPNQRAGILTQIGFLASHADSMTSSPIHRGVFVQQTVLCTAIPPPGEQVPPLPPTTAGKTTREVVTEHTNGDGCRGCHHGFINPVGFGFENYDAIGAWRITENGKPVDASGSLVATEKNLRFSNAVELARALVASPETRLCYARQWLRYSFGREEKPADGCALELLARALEDDAYSAVDLAVDLVRTRAFMFRSAEGL